jgi:hypothetical protein
MKILFSIFLVSLGITFVCNAQAAKKEPIKFQNCEAIIHNFYSKVKSIKTKRAAKIDSISCIREHTLSNHADIKKYFHKISDDNYYYTYSPKSKALVLRQGKNIMKTHKKNKKWFSSLSKKLHSALKPGSTIYVVKLKTNNGKNFRDYFITDVKNRFAYDNAFIFLEFLKFKKTSGQYTRSQKVIKVQTKKDTSSHHK